MLTIAKRPDGIVHIQASGQLKAEDYVAFVPQFERVAQREAGTLAMVIDLAPDFSGWDLGGLWRELKFDARHRESFGRIAIIGDAKWEEWGTKITDPFFRAEMKFFEPSERRAAEDWARGRGEPV